MSHKHPVIESVEMAQRLPRSIHPLAVFPFLLILSVGSLLAQPPKPEAKDKKFALLVGVNEYQNRKLENLKYAERDVTELAEVLKAAGFEVRVLVGSGTGPGEATKAKVEAAFTELLKSVSKMDTVLLAFSGHGQQLFVETEGPDGGKVKKEVPFYCPKDAVPTEPGTLVSISAILKRLDEKGGGHNLLLVDACRDVADANQGRRGGIDSSRVESLGEGTAVFLACASRQKALETEKAGGGHGVFFHFVIEGLKGGAKNSKDEVTWERLVLYVKEKVKEEVPSWFEGLAVEERQRPQAIGNFTDDPVLVFANSALDLGSIREPKPGEERAFEIAPGVKMVFCWIPPGTVQLGSPKEERELVWKQVVEAKLDKMIEDLVWEHLESERESQRGKFATKGYWLGKYPVTQEEWQAVMGDNPSWFQPGGKGREKLQAANIRDTARFPVEMVSWDDCQKFLEKVNSRGGVAKVFGKAGRFVLPQEDQWEYACRGGKGNKKAFYWGDELNGTQANSRGDYPFGTATIGQYLERTCSVDFTNGGKYEKHPWGLCHMSGNVWQWCSNLYEQTAKRVLRGGSWFNYARICRSAFRYWIEPDNRSDIYGFRVYLPLDK